jgi:hypothetical protein
MKLAQAAGRLLAQPQPCAARSGATPSTDRVEQIEQNSERIERVELGPVAASEAVNRNVPEAIVDALEARLAEHAGLVERRVAGLEASLALELRSLVQQDHSIVKRVAGNIGALRQQMVSLHREFGEAVARIVAEQVSSQVQAHAAAWDQSIPERIASAVEAAVPAAIDTRLPAAVNASVARLEQQLRENLEQKDREIDELRQRLADTDTKVSELILGIGQICRQAAGKVAPPNGSPEAESAHRQSPSRAVNTPTDPIPAGPGGGSGQFAELRSGPREPTAQSLLPAVPEDGAGPEGDEGPAPGSAQARKASRLWRVPLVSSVVIVTSGLALQHFL